MSQFNYFNISVSEWCLLRQFFFKKNTYFQMDDLSNRKVSFYNYKNISLDFFSGSLLTTFTKNQVLFSNSYILYLNVIKDFLLKELTNKIFIHSCFLNNRIVSSELLIKSFVSNKYSLIKSITLFLNSLSYIFSFYSFFYFFYFRWGLFSNLSCNTVLLQPLIYKVIIETNSI